MTLCLKLFIIEKAMQNQTRDSFPKGNLHQRACDGIIGYVDLRTLVLWEGFKSKVLSGV